MNRPIDLLGDDNDHGMLSLDNYIDDFVEGNADLLEDTSPSGNEEMLCGFCNKQLDKPRLLACLHVFCEACIDSMMVDGTGDHLKVDQAIVCPTCSQETKVFSTSTLKRCDFLLSPGSPEELALCTSCKAREPAWSRCEECDHLLCLHCHTAHRFMRCFAQHAVTRIYHAARWACQKHTDHTLDRWCHTCQHLACSACSSDHGPPCRSLVPVGDAGPPARAQLTSLVAETHVKARSLDQTSLGLETGLSDLQAQQDEAAELINETFHSCRAILEKQRDERLQELRRLHAERELRIMEAFHNVEQTTDSLQDACRFAGSLLDHGSTHDVLSLKPDIEAHLARLVANSPVLPAEPPQLAFHSDIERFEAAVSETFGSFQPPISEAPIISATPSPTPSVHRLTSIQEYNLQALASLAVKEVPAAVVQPPNQPPSQPPVDPASPTPSFTLADLFCGDALNNLQALAQLVHTPSPSPPPPTLAAIISDYSNGRVGSMGQQNVILGRGENTSSMDINPYPMNLSGTPSPNLSDDLLTDLSASTNGSSYQFRGCAGKLNPMQIRCKYGQLGPSKGQFNSPHGFCLGGDEDIIVADTNNHRIQVFDKVGTFKFQFGIPGKEEGQLWYPRKVAVMRPSGKFVVCDRGNERSRMQIFTKNGHFVKKIAIRYVDIVAGLAVTHQGHIVAVDSVSPTVFVISEAGDLIRWFDCSDYMREPSDIAINGREFFVCDFKGHCVVVFNEEGQFMRRIGNENITNFPNGIDISDAGDVLVGDSHGNRFHVAVFTRDGMLLSEFECPYVKVSRCCGLKITSEGYVVTLAKNNHHVLVLNTLYIV